MTPEATLTQKVEQLRVRAKLMVTQRWLLRGLLAGTGACALAALIWRLVTGWAPVEWVPIALLLVAAAGAVYGWTRPVTPLDAARLADRRLQLRERLSSGLQFLGQPERDGLVAAQIEDAARHSAKVEARDVFPYRLPRETRWLAATLALLLAVLYLPELPMFQSPRKRAEAATLRREGERLQKLAREVTRRRLTTNAEITRRVAENMRSLGVGLQRGRVEKKQAMLAVHKMSKELRETQRRMAAPTGAKSLSRAALELRQAANDPRLAGSGQAPRTMADLAQSLEKRDLEAAAKALRDLEARLKSGALSEAEAKAAADALSRMAQALKDTDLDAASKQLQEAAKQLRDAQKLAQGLSKEQAERLRQLAARRAAASCGQAGGT